jgi:RNA polymerase subunit RPABC4/transcription elongation factor Spt4
MSSGLAYPKRKPVTVRIRTFNTFAVEFSGKSASLLMQKKECPSCAMEIDQKSKVCPVCGYEFTDHRNSGLKWVALLLAILFLLYLVFY